MTRTADEQREFEREYYQDDDLRVEAAIERREAARATRCRCVDEPGRGCPGPASCPYSDYAEDAA